MDEVTTLQARDYKRGEQGFSLVEVLIAIVVMTIVTGAIFALLRDSMKTSQATMELTDAQESARTGQEYITRDLVNTGDGLNSLNNISVPEGFVTNYLTQSPVTDGAPAGLINLGLITADNNVPVNTLVLGTAPAVQVRSTPYLTDRITILQLERPEIFTPITLAAGALTPADGVAVVSPVDIDHFRVGEIYFITSAVGGIFATIRELRDVATPTPKLVFAAGDVYGLNSVNQLNAITAGATLPISIMRMKLIHYYINSDGLLMRRVFGVKGNGFSESVIAEHVVSLQFRYFLNLRDADGNVVQPTAQLATSQEQVETRQIEVTLVVETPHSLQNGKPQQISMTTSTSVRNMQFRQSLQPTAGG
ncbi:MAG TPA: prepilin-type N-terminal cleavage/methylation domain-containing protein [Pyrinomonadaceae bacterium]|nr:prepilin-type N-terminal cleavage/methylation domain-containing protein [Pyrinomonadaceae bacterium]